MLKNIPFGDLYVGRSALMVRYVTDALIQAVAAWSGDHNPAHLQDDYAAKTQFKTRIAHGLIVEGWLSALLGTQLPGLGAVYVSKSIKFHNPMRIGDRITLWASVRELFPPRLGRSFGLVKMIFDATNQDYILVASGELVVTAEVDQLEAEHVEPHPSDAPYWRL